MAWDHVEEEIYTFIIRSSNSVATVASNVISINSCVVSHGGDLSESPPITASSGLSMFVYSIVQYKLNVSICKVSGISIEQFNTLPSMSGLEVLIQNLKFINNSRVKPEQILDIASSNSLNVVAVEKVSYVKIINCTFVVNKQTALQAFDSTLYFGGHVIFSENRGTFGGATILLGGSTMYLMPRTHIQIMNNHAKRGGGIYDNTVTITPRFFQLLDL